MAHRVIALVTAPSTIAVSQLARELSTDSSLQIVTATTPAELWKQIETSRPRVVLLDTQLSGEGTPQLVAELTQKAKIPTLLRSDRSLSAGMLLDAMEAGALAILDKPSSSTQRAEIIPSIIWNIRAAESANLISTLPADFLPVESSDATSMLALGAGTGALPALTSILRQLPADAPGAILIAPLPAQVISAWADRLNRRCKMTVTLAAEGDVIKRGRILIAPADSHLLVRRSAQGFTVSVKNGPAVFHQKPSIEILFNSIAEQAGSDAVGVLLGGAGVDGVAGLMHLKNRGGRTIAESESSSVIADAPGRAKKCGAVDAMIPANEIAAKMMAFAARSNSRAA